MLMQGQHKPALTLGLPEVHNSVIIVLGRLPSFPLTMPVFCIRRSYQPNALSPLINLTDQIRTIFLSIKKWQAHLALGLSQSRD